MSKLITIKDQDIVLTEEKVSIIEIGTKDSEAYKEALSLVMRIYSDYKFIKTIETNENTGTIKIVCLKSGFNKVDMATKFMEVGEVKITSNTAYILNECDLFEIIEENTKNEYPEFVFIS